MRQYDKHSVKQTKQNKRKHPSFKVPPKLFQWNNKVHAALFFYYERDSPKVDWILQWKSSFCMYAYDTCIYIYIHILRDEKNTIHVCGCLRASMCEVSVCVHECTCVIGKTPTPIPLLPCPLLFARIQSKRCCNIYPLRTADHSNINKKDFL